MTESSSIIGRTISHYTVEAKIGGGGMGVVYKAEDTRLGRKVALKFLPEALAREVQAIERFRREARAASALNHPNICTVYDVGEFEGHPFLVMELLEGQTLKQRLGKKSIPVTEVLDIGLQVVSGLEAAHNKGIVHRDIKPANIFLVEGGTAKILDFGLAKLATFGQPEEKPADGSAQNVPEDALATSPGSSMGTVAYMSPEQARGETLDARSDVFSLGVVLYEMATGVLPFPGATIALIFEGVLHYTATPATRVNPHVPLALEHVLSKALEKDIALRYQTATELRMDLKRVKRDVDTGVEESSREIILGQVKPHRKPRVRSWQKWALGAAALAALLATLWFSMARTVAQPRVLRTVQLTNTNRPKSGVVTDGTRLYFVDGLEGLSQTSVSGGDTVKVATSLEDTGFTNVFDIAASGPSLLMNTAHGTALDGPLWSVPVLGGSPRRLGNLEGHAGAWSPDRLRIVFSKADDIFVARNDGGGAAKLLHTDGTASDLRWSPDGTIVRFTLSDPHTNSRTIWEAREDGSNLHALLPGWSSSPNECCGNWTPDGKYFVFAGERDGTTNLWAIREHGGVFRSRHEDPVQLTTGPMNVGDPVPSVDGKKLFVQGWQTRGELVRYDSRTSQFVPYLSGISALGLDFSRDGQWVAYNDGTDGTMWRSKLDGTQKLQLALPPMRAYLPRWSPDGKQIAFFGHPPGEPWQIYRVSAEGGAQELLYKSTMNLADPSWSPDGKSLAFGENSLNNQGSAIYVLDLQTRKATKLPGSDGLYSPRWSPDGNYIAAIPLDSLKLMLFDLAKQQWIEAARIFVAYPTWSHDGRFIYFDGILDNQEGFYRLQVSNHKLEKLFSMKGFQAAGGAFGNWSGLGPDDTPLLVRDASIQEIYVLDWDTP